jgi:sterol desaturase/sphingolipid hydroxylase (fatty acid hydroxylase superfamily)
MDAKRRDITPPAHPSTSLIFMEFQEWQKPRNHQKIRIRISPRAQDQFTRDVVYGSKAMFLALLMATASIRWCLAQLPEILHGVILPRSVVKYLMFLISL